MLLYSKPDMVNPCSLMMSILWCYWISWVDLLSSLSLILSNILMFFCAFWERLLISNPCVEFLILENTLFIFKSSVLVTEFLFYSILFLLYDFSKSSLRIPVWSSRSFIFSLCFFSIYLASSILENFMKFWQFWCPLTVKGKTFKNCWSYLVQRWDLSNSRLHFRW